jgi:hypothetical protein
MGVYFAIYLVVSTKKMISSRITASTKNLDQSSIRIFVAESDPLEMARIRLGIDVEFRNRLKTIKNHDELLQALAAEMPQLLILGRIDNSNYFEICQESQLIRPGLPIILISKQEIVNETFHQVIKSYGVTEIISDDFTCINQLLQALDLISEASQSFAVDQDFTGKMLLEGLQEIVVISNNYFGNLAQGNYWRKSYTAAVAEFPFLLEWSADHFCNLDCDASILEKDLTEIEIHSIRTWVHYFIRECERIIIDYGVILNNSDLSLYARTLLTTP